MMMHFVLYCFKCIFVLLVRCSSGKIHCSAPALILMEIAIPGLQFKILMTLPYFKSGFQNGQSAL